MSPSGTAIFVPRNRPFDSATFRLFGARTTRSFRQRERADRFAAREPRQPAFLLFVAAGQQQRFGREIHRRRERHRRHCAAEFLGDDAQFEIAEAEAAVLFRNRGRGPTHLADLLPQTLVVRRLAFEDLAHRRRRAVVLQESVCLLAQQVLLFRKLEIHASPQGSSSSNSTVSNPICDKSGELALSTLSGLPQPRGAATGAHGSSGGHSRYTSAMNDMTELGYLRAAAAAPAVALADPAENAQRIAAEFHQLAAEGASVVLFPELSVTGYSCEDLFFTRALLDASRAALASLVRATSGTQAVLVVGAPWLLADGRLLNCAFVAARGRLLGAVPKSRAAELRRVLRKALVRLRRRHRASPSTTTCSAHSRSRTNQLFEIGESALRDRDLRRPVGARSDRQSARARRRRPDTESVRQHRSHRQSRLPARSRPDDERPAHLRLSVRVVRADRVDEGRRVRRPSDRGGERSAARRVRALRARRQPSDRRLRPRKAAPRPRHQQHVCGRRAPTELRVHRHRCYAGADRDVDAQLSAASVRAGRRTRIRRARAGNPVDSGDGSRASSDGRAHPRRW